MQSPKEDNICKQEVFNRIFEKYASDLFNFLYYKFGPDNHPEDIVQETFSKLWDNCEKVTEDKAKSFLFTVANNHMLNELSKKKTILNYRNEATQKNTTHESPEFLYQGKEYFDLLKEALEELTEDQRVTFLMNRVEGKKHKEIAELLGVSRKTVEKRIYTALKILKKKLGKI